MKKKILFFIGTLNDGGAQRVVSIISSKIVEKGFDVEILKYYECKNVYPLSDKVKITCVLNKTNSKNILSNTKWIHNYFKNNADVIISFLAPFNIIALLANIGTNIPIIVADRNDPNKVPGNLLIRKVRNMLYKYSDKIVVQNSNNSKYFNSDKCVVIENPFDDKNNIGKALVTKKAKKIVTVGRVCEQKNQLMIIKAFSKIKNKYQDYIVEIYGDDESYMKVLEKQIIDLGLSEHIKFMGSQTNILNKISNAELFVLCSNYEGMPNALIEAMCLGLPCISTKVSGAVDLIKNDFNGMLIDIDDVYTLADKMDELLSDDKKRLFISENATKIANDLDSDVITNKWIDLIENV